MAFVNSYYAQGSGDTATVLAFLQRIYAEQIDYYGRVQSKAYVLNDKKYYFKRWPVRSTVQRTGSAKIECNPSSSIYSYTGEVDWSVDNPPHPGKKGASLVALGIQILGPQNSMVIVRESSTTEGKHGSNADPKSVPQLLPIDGSGFANDTLSGSAQIYNGHLKVAGRPLALFGIDSFLATPANLTNSINNWLKNKGDLTCDRMPGNTFRCVTGETKGVDVAQFAISNGAAKASADALPEYKQAENQAQAGRRGVWQ